MLLNMNMNLDRMKDTPNDKFKIILKKKFNLKIKLVEIIYCLPFSHSPQK